MNECHTLEPVGLAYHLVSPAGSLATHGGTMTELGKYYVDVDRIGELARSGKRQLDDYSRGKATNLGLIVNTFSTIERLVQHPLDDLPSGTVEFTISERVVRMLTLDVLGHDNVMVTGTGGGPESRWYRLDIPRAFALRLLWELEDRWLKGETQSDRRVARVPFKNLKQALGV